MSQIDQQNINNENELKKMRKFPLYKKIYDMTTDDEADEEMLNIMKVLTDEEQMYDKEQMYNNKTALMLAAQKKFAKICKILIDNKIGIENIKQALVLAITNCDLETCKNLIANATNATNENVKTLLITFVKTCDNPDIFKLLIEAGADINAIDEFDMTPLMIAVKDKKVEIIKHLLSIASIDVNIQSTFSKTALMFAFDSKNIEIIEMLLNDTRVDVNIQDKYGKIALMYALDLKNNEIIKNVISKLNNINGKTALMNAFDSKNIEIIKMLLEDEHIDVNIQDKNGKTVFMYAFGLQNIEIIKKVISKLNNINVKNQSGKTALGYAIHTVNNVNNEIIKHLLSIEYIDVNIPQDEKYRSALSCACYVRNIEIIKMLLDDKHVNVNMKSVDEKNPNNVNATGKTALIWAVDNYSKDETHNIIKMLLEDERIDVNIQDKTEKTALMHVDKYKIYETKNMFNNDNSDAVKSAINAQNLEKIQMLFDKGSNEDNIKYDITNNTNNTNNTKNKPRTLKDYAIETLNLNILKKIFKIDDSDKINENEVWKIILNYFTQMKYEHCSIVQKYCYDIAKKNKGENYDDSQNTKALLEMEKRILEIKKEINKINKTNNDNETFKSIISLIKSISIHHGGGIRNPRKTKKAKGKRQKAKGKRSQTKKL